MYWLPGQSIPTNKLQEIFNSLPGIQVHFISHQMAVLKIFTSSFKNKRIVKSQGH